MNDYVLRLKSNCFTTKNANFRKLYIFQQSSQVLVVLLLLLPLFILLHCSDVSPCFHRLFLFSSCELMLLWGPCVVADILVLQYHEIFNDSNYAQFLQFPVKKVLVKKYWKCVLAVNKQKNLYWKFLKHVTREISEV